MKDPATDNEILRLSASQEDYLREIYLLQQLAEEVRVTDVASQLGISKPSVNRALHSLQELGLIIHQHYGRIVLTEKGYDAAESIPENYKVLYRFFTDILGVDAETASAQAHLMEHSLTKGTRKKLKKHIKACKGKK